jgi:serine/threonine protein kinase
VHLVKAIAYLYNDTRTEHTFIFPWAEYGNLWEFWNHQKIVPEDREYFVNVFKQLTCLACAIDEISNEGLRHGDLKPENIVCFKTDNGIPYDQKDPSIKIRLVIIDVGLAKTHAEATKKRLATDTLVSTRRYAAPELETKTRSELSRRFDVWSMGCIFLEFTIWLLYGTDELIRFTSSLKEGSEQIKFFVTKSDTNTLKVSGQSPKKTAELGRGVKDMISRIMADPRCTEKTAVRRLVELIRDKLLVVDLSDEEPPPPETNGESSCACVKNKPSISLTDQDIDSEPKPTQHRKPTPQNPTPEFLLLTHPPTVIVKGNGPNKPGRCYARVMKAALKKILAELKDGSIEPIMWGAKLKEKAPCSQLAGAAGLLKVRVPN